MPAYTQNDVEELARALTGWRRKSFYEPMYVRLSAHDFAEKTILGETFPAGQSADQDMEQAVDLLFNHPNTPVFIAIQLIKRLTISNPRRQYISRVANAFKDNGQGVRGDLTAVVKAILLDQDLLDGKGMGDYQSAGSRLRNFGKVKEPVIAMANLARALNVQSNDATRWWDYPQAINDKFFGHQHQLYHVDLTGFDTHKDQAEPHHKLLKTLSEGMAAFYQDMVAQGLSDQVTTFTMSDFGRRMMPNSTGTDHGWAGHQLVTGGAVKGGKAYGNWPDLRPGSAYDYNNGRIIPEIAADQVNATLASWFGYNGDLEALFPSLANGFSSPTLGFMSPA